MKIGFVILHYQAIDVTEECVTSLLNVDADNNVIMIYIVDNASPNGSGLKLLDKYSSAENVKVILSEENVGFAKGNNIGYRKAKEDGADFIIMSNNDIVIDNKSFVLDMLDIYNNHQFGVLGPDIISIKDGVHQNPMRGMIRNKHELFRQIVKVSIRKFLNEIGVLGFIMKRRSTSYDNNDYKNQREILLSSDFILHGSFFIFSPIYVQKYDGLFENTFMYYEESILAYQCLNSNIKMLYSPDISVNHYRNISTKDTNKNLRRRERFYCSNALKSLRAFREIMN